MICHNPTEDNKKGPGSKETMTRPNIESSRSARFDRLCQETFQEAHSISRRFMGRNLSKKDKHLKNLFRLALKNQIPSEYPFLFRFSYSNVEEDYEDIKSLAAAIHLLQTSTFVIDDILDSSALRNHNKTIYKKFGANYAILTGELLQASALETISSEIEHGVYNNKCLALKAFNEIVRDVYLGQYLDVFNSSNHHISTKDYYRVISLTTGNFLANVAKSGALLANKPDSDTKILTEYGYYYGMAMQITDDIVDIIQKPETTGKSFATDLKCRRMRLPYLLALDLSDRKDAGRLRNFLRERDPSTRDIHYVVKLIQTCGAIDACKGLVKRYISKSVKNLSYLKNPLTKESLIWLSESLLEDQGLND
jgi:geranylgeranyl pyrophosphate synthase